MGRKDRVEGINAGIAYVEGHELDFDATAARYRISDARSQWVKSRNPNRPRNSCLTRNGDKFWTRTQYDMLTDKCGILST